MTEFSSPRVREYPIPDPCPPQVSQPLADVCQATGGRHASDCCSPASADIQAGEMVNVMPATFLDLPDAGPARPNERARSTVVLVRMRPEDLARSWTGNWHVDGIVAYSKICTHVGCPVSLYDRTTHHLLCPCHQATFDLADNGAVVFGPATRPLPQLPLGVDGDGYLIARSDFTEPVGPSYWERDA